MAIYIQIRKLSEDNAVALYSFGALNEIIGKIKISKSSGAISLIEITDSARTQFYLSRVGRKLAQHFEKGEFPDETCYAA